MIYAAFAGCEPSPLLDGSHGGERCGDSDGCDGRGSRVRRSRIAECIQQAEGSGEECDPEQVAQGRQIGDGRIVRVHSTAPHPVHHAARRVQQQCHLNESGRHVAGQEHGGDHSVARGQEPNGVHKDEVPWQHHQHQEPRRASMRALAAESRAGVDAALAVRARVAAQLGALGQQGGQLAWLDGHQVAPNPIYHRLKDCKAMVRSDGSV